MEASNTAKSYEFRRRGMLLLSSTVVAFLLEKDSIMINTLPLKLLLKKNKTDNASKGLTWKIDLLYSTCVVKAVCLKITCLKFRSQLI